MGPEMTTYILGSGAIGFPLAAYQAHAGRHVVAVRTSREDIPRHSNTVTVHSGANSVSAAVETISLSRLTHLDGMIVIATKTHANQAIALQLKDKGATGPIVIMQNGIGVEKPFLEAGFCPVYRCILYVTSQATSGYDFTFRRVASSPVGIVTGGEPGLARCVKDLTTDEFSFRAELRMQREIWKKAIVNVVFNSLCPLLEIDNGVFVRDKTTAALARELVKECVTITDRGDLDLTEDELIAQIMQISRQSDGQLISTLQGIRNGRPTEMEFLNLEVVRVGAAMQPKLDLPRVELLGKMILAKSLQQLHPRCAGA